MRALIEIIHDQVDPIRICTCRESKLIRVPFVSWEGNQWGRGILLGFPGCLVEVAEGYVVVASHLLDLGVDEVGLGCCFWEMFQY